MSHIAIDARIMNSSTGRYIERLVHYLEEIDTTNIYSILMRKKDLKFYTPINPNFHIIEADFDDYSLAEQIGFKKLLDELSPDLVHFCMPQQPVLYKGKKVTTVHDMILLKTYNSDKNFLIFKFKQFVGRFVFKHIARNSNHIIVPTDFTKKDFIKYTGFSGSNLTKSYESADIIKTSPIPYNDLTNKEYILYVGSESDYKNIPRLIEAHQLLIQKHPDLILVLVGKLTGKNGAGAARNKAWSKNQHHKNILFTDFVPDEQLAWLYRNARVYVFPSLMEGFGLPALEAMLYSLPVASSNATCLPEVYGDAAVYFDPTNIIAMADAINSILTNPSLSRELVKKGHIQAKKYSWERMARETHAVYLKVLTSSPEQ